MPSVHQSSSQVNYPSKEAQSAARAESASNLEKGAAAAGEAIKDSMQEIAQGIAEGSVHVHERPPYVFPEGKAPGKIDLGHIINKLDQGKAALNLVDKMSKTRGNDAELASQVMKFDAMVDNMDRDDLMEVAKGLTERLKNTDGKDQLLGTLLQRVLAELDEKDTGSILDKIKPMPFPEPLPMPWPRPIEPFPGKPLPCWPKDNLFELHQAKPMMGGGAAQMMGEAVQKAQQIEQD